MWIPGDKLKGVVRCWVWRVDALASALSARGADRPFLRASNMSQVAGMTSASSFGCKFAFPIGIATRVRDAGHRVLSEYWV